MVIHVIQNRYIILTQVRIQNDLTLSQSESDFIDDFESKKYIKIISTQMPSELLETLFKNMTPTSNFQHMVLAQNYPTAKESFQRMAENGSLI